jgi:hypothetical protein
MREGWTMSIRSRILILGVVLVMMWLPAVAALPPCLVQNINYTYPSTPVGVGQQITVKTEVQATCVQWPPYATAYSIRVDLTNVATGVVGSTISYQVGYAQTYIDQVFPNTITAPNSPGTWNLRVDVYIWGGSGQLLVHAADYAKLQVG